MAAAGLMVRNRGVFEFIPAALVRAVRYDFVVTPYPGTELGMTLFAGRVIPVLSYGDDGHALIVCDIEGEIVGLTGLEPIQSGLLEGDDRSAVYEGVRVPHLNVREQLDRSRPQRRMQEEPWPT
jgi:hypothetical protein